MKNVKLKDFTLNDLLLDIRQSYNEHNNYEDAAIAMRDKVDKYIEEIK
jgi:hypothetical protein